MHICITIITLALKEIAVFRRKSVQFAKSRDHNVDPGAPPKRQARPDPDPGGIPQSLKVESFCARRSCRKIRWRWQWMLSSTTASTTPPSPSPMWKTSGTAKRSPAIGWLRREGFIELIDSKLHVYSGITTVVGSNIHRTDRLKVTCL
jgi:hypothetical protein